MSSDDDTKVVRSYSELWLNGFDVVRDVLEDSSKNDKVVARYVNGTSFRTVNVVSLSENK